MAFDDPYRPPQAKLADPVPEAGGELELARRGARLAASILDSMFSVVLILPFMWYSGWLDKVMAGETSLLDQLAMGGLGIVVWIVLNGYLQYKRGQSLGKAIMKIKIVRADGSRADLTQLVGVRFAAFNAINQIPFIGGIFGLVDVLFLFRDDRRCIHDLVAGTKVVVA